jgi:hypothetical protein
MLAETGESDGLLVLDDNPILLILILHSSHVSNPASLLTLPE